MSSRHPIEEVDLCSSQSTVDSERRGGRYYPVHPVVTMDQSSRCMAVWHTVALNSVISTASMI